MKGRQILIEPLPDGGHAAALMIDGIVEDVLIDPAVAPDGMTQPEAIYMAVAGRPMKGMGGVLVELGDGRSGFLRAKHLPSPGQRVMVQVSTWAETGKAPPVTDRIMLKGKSLILTPFAPGINVSKNIRETDRGKDLINLTTPLLDDMDATPGLIIRTAAAEIPDTEITDELGTLLHDWENVLKAAEAGQSLLRAAPGAANRAWRDWSTAKTDIFENATALADSGAWEQLEALLDPVVPLGQGMMSIEPTKALVAVDVNTGSDTSPAAALKINLATAAELPRQLRLRGLGGLIVVDFAPLARKDRNRVLSALGKSFRKDGVETSVAGWTPVGNLELQRKRSRRALSVHADQIKHV